MRGVRDLEGTIGTIYLTAELFTFLIHIIMSYFKGEKEFFPGIGQIQFEGRESKNPLAFHYYDADKVVMGKTLKDHLRFAMAYWNNLCAYISISCCRC